MDHALKKDLHVAELLAELLATNRPLLMSMDGAGEYFGSLGSRHAAASTLEGVLEGLTDHPRMKTCARDTCVSRGRPKPLWSFGADRDSADGHASVCKSCEAKRVAEIGRKSAVAVTGHQNQVRKALGEV